MTFLREFEEKFNRLLARDALVVSFPCPSLPVRRERPRGPGDSQRPVEGHGRALWLGDGPSSQSRSSRCPSGHGHQRNSPGTPLTVLAPQAAGGRELSGRPRESAGRPGSRRPCCPQLRAQLSHDVTTLGPALRASFSDRTPQACAAASHRRLPGGAQGLHPGQARGGACLRRHSKGRAGRAAAPLPSRGGAFPFGGLGPTG